MLLTRCDSSGLGTAKQQIRYGRIAIPPWTPKMRNDSENDASLLRPEHITYDTSYFLHDAALVLVVYLLEHHRGADTPSEKPRDVSKTAYRIPWRGESTEWQAGWPRIRTHDIISGRTQFGVVPLPH